LNFYELKFHSVQKIKQRCKGSVTSNTCSLCYTKFPQLIVVIKMTVSVIKHKKNKTNRNRSIEQLTSFQVTCLLMLCTSCLTGSFPTLIELSLLVTTCFPISFGLKNKSVILQYTVASACRLRGPWYIFVCLFSLCVGILFVTAAKYSARKTCPESPRLIIFVSKVEP